LAASLFVIRASNRKGGRASYRPNRWLLVRDSQVINFTITSITRGTSAASTAFEAVNHEVVGVAAKVLLELVGRALQRRVPPRIAGRRRGRIKERRQMTLRLLGVLVSPRSLRNNNAPRIEHQRDNVSKPSSKRTGPKKAKHRGRAASTRSSTADTPNT